MTVIRRRTLAASALFFTQLAIEFLDEFVQGVREVAMPLIRDDLNLTYEQIGILIGLPIVIGTLFDPIMGLLADTHRRQRMILIGGAGLTLELALFALTGSFEMALLLLVVFSLGSGMYVSLSQATLMDMEPDRHEQNMARWSLAGALGWVLGTLLITGMVAVGLGWRGAYLTLAGFAALTLIVLIRLPFPGNSSNDDDEEDPSLMELARGALEAIRQPQVVRWLILLPFGNLMLDVLHGYLALYFVDVVGVDEATAGVAVLVWTGVGLLGDALLIPLLERMPGMRYLRISAVIEFVLLTAFLLVPWLPLKLVILGVMGMFNAGWYAIMQGQLYTSMPGRSGVVIGASSTADFIGALMPLVIGFVAGQVGLGAAMWLFLAAPVALLVGLPRRQTADLSRNV